MRFYGVLCYILLTATAIMAQEKPVQAPARNKLDSLSQELSRLKEKVRELEEAKEAQELENLRKAALQSSTEKVKEEALKTKTFRQGATSLQKLNPELSIVGDMVANYKTDAPHYTEGSRSGFDLRVFDINFQSNLDPFSRAKATVTLGENGFELEEGYVIWTNLLPKINVTVGKFRQQFGVVNRWHEHALDQIFYPLALQTFMGDEGLIETGASFNWLMPNLTASANELTVQITNSSNPELFSGENFSVPSTLFHFKNYYDLSQNAYLELGLTGMIGTNDSLGFTFSKRHRWTHMAGVDLTYSWSPVNQALYKGFLWRSELFYLNKDRPTGGPIKAWGGYSYMEYQPAERYKIGTRVDVVQPVRIDNSGQYQWQVVPYLTYRQSEFVYLRLEWSHLESHGFAGNDNRLLLQVDWSLGPHKHEKY